MPKVCCNTSRRASYSALHLRYLAMARRIRVFLYSLFVALTTKYPCRFDGGSVYDFDLIRRLCTEISAEKDEAGAHELISLLQAVIREDIDEIRIRIGISAAEVVK